MIDGWDTPVPTPEPTPEPTPWGGSSSSSSSSGDWGGPSKRVKKARRRSYSAAKPKWGASSEDVDVVIA